MVQIPIKNNLKSFFFFNLILLLICEVSTLGTTENLVNINHSKSKTLASELNENLNSEFFKMFDIYSKIQIGEGQIFRGKWRSDDNFLNMKNKEGDFIIQRFLYNYEEYAFSNISSFTFKTILYDGEGHDNSLYLSQIIKSLNTTEEMLIFSNFNTTIKYFHYSIVEFPFFAINEEDILINNSEIIFEYSQKNDILRKNLPKISGFMEIYSQKFSFEAKEEDYYFNIESKMSDYSVIISILGLIQLYQSYSLCNEIVSDSNYAKNIPLIMVSHNIFWNFYIIFIHSIIFLIHSSLNFNSPFFTPLIIFLLNFFFFEGRILFFVWQSRHLNLSSRELKRKYLLFLLMFYFVFSGFVLSSRIIFSNYETILAFYIFSLAPQIYHNYKFGQAKIPLNYFWSLVLIKIFFPLYFRVYCDNFVSLSPLYGKSIILMIVLLFELFLLHIQNKYGSKILLPKYFREKKYDYYIDYNMILENKDCIICLEDLKIVSTNELDENSKNSYFENNKMSLITLIKNKISYYFFDSLVRKSLMRTPCEHYFHSDCFELWIKKKLECPYCKNPLPYFE